MLKRLALALLATFVVFETSFTQISPGKLSRYHAEIEGMANCTKCHELGESVRASKCLECHRLLKARIDDKKGYHASPEVTGSTCVKCHSDHHGLEFELVRWQNTPQEFDHVKTGFKLEGAHAKQDCRACHKLPFNEAGIASDKHINSARTFLGLTSTCTACHQDEHRGALDQTCTKCHTMEAWKSASKYDHASARFLLTGKHGKVECSKCHKSENAGTSKTILLTKKVGAGSFLKYKPIEFSSCASCHKDVHQNKFGQDCASCHVTTGFSELKSASFDHSKTRYPLVGKHLSVNCAKCHTSGKKTGKMKFDLCLDCHDDQHGGQFASRPDQGECKSCHTLTGWTPASYGIDQHQAGRFPLTGGHLATPCLLCHKQEDKNGRNIAHFVFDKVTCNVCHVDIHNKDADKWMGAKSCDACHKTESWNSVNFDHSLTKFPLAGKHQSKSCRDCHLIASMPDNKKALKLTGLAINCSGCHNDPHQRQFSARTGGGECSQCHAADGWLVQKFDHNNANFKLDGAHAKVSCEKCHHEEIGKNGVKFIRYSPLPISCKDCHKG